jgi:PIN domain nuclease of toxin-antitoxin system
VKLLLDSHTLLWWLIDDPRLSSRAREAIQQATASVFVSAASVWEIAIKAAKGKLRLPPGAEDRIRSAMASAGFVELPVMGSCVRGTLAECAPSGSVGPLTDRAKPN